MKGKGSLALMEQIVMLLVFALASALCLQAFVKSDQLSRRSEAADHAAVLCQSVAETIQSTQGDFEKAAQILEPEFQSKDSLSIYYTPDWQRAEVLSSSRYDVVGYVLGADRIETDVPGLGKAQVWVLEGENGQELFSIEISWQEEVTAHG